MTYVAYAIAVIWAGVGIFLCGRQLNLTRLVFNNLAPGADFSGPDCEFLHTGQQASPETVRGCLNSDGQEYYRQSNRNVYFLGGWAIVSFILAIVLVPRAVQEPEIGAIAFVVVFVGGLYLLGRRLRLKRATRIERGLYWMLNGLFFLPLK